MKKYLLLSIACLGISSAWAQDGCATALPIVAGTYTVATVNGPQIPDPICALNGNTNVTASEWYTYTPAQDLALTITTEASGVDTRFHVYTGSCGALVCAGGDDDSGVGNTSLTTINVVGGLTYTIAFDNRWSAAGFQFQLLENAIVETPISFTQVYLPSGGYVQCVVDMDGDMLDDAVYATQGYVSINHQMAGGGFTNMMIGTPTVVNSSSWSMAAGDLDDNGYTDLLYGGGSGCSILLANEDGTNFNAISPPQYIFSQRTNMVDINNDGHLDVFVCHDIAPNVYYYHDGNGNFEYHQGGLGDNGGNYGSIWTDFDGDHDVDMFIAKCGSSPPDVLCQNNGNGTFTNVAAELGFADYQQSWSSAWGDYDNDGDMDALIGSSSSGYHKLMLNDGTGHFTNITAGSGFDSFVGQSIEWTTHDFNNDGYLDVLGGGALMLNNGDLTFTPITIQAYNGPIGDLNNDGSLDIVNYGTVMMNDGNDNNYLKVYLTGTQSNRNGIGARVEVISALGTQIRDVKAGDGFEFMSSITAHFGLGAETEVSEVVVYWPSGIVQTVSNPDINGTLNIIEGVSTSVTEKPMTAELAVFPNPADDVLNVTSDQQNLSNHVVSILDITGKCVLTTTVRHGQVDITALNSGLYILQVASDNGMLQRKFTKR